MLSEKATRVLKYLVSIDKIPESALEAGCCTEWQDDVMFCFEGTVTEEEKQVAYHVLYDNLTKMYQKINRDILQKKLVEYGKTPEEIVKILG